MELVFLDVLGVQDAPGVQDLVAAIVQQIVQTDVDQAVIEVLLGAVPVALELVVGHAGLLALAHAGVAHPAVGRVPDAGQTAVPCATKVVKVIAPDAPNFALGVVVAVIQLVTDVGEHQVHAPDAEEAVLRAALDVLGAMGVVTAALEDVKQIALGAHPDAKMAV